MRQTVGASPGLGGFIARIDSDPNDISIKSGKQVSQRPPTLPVFAAVYLYIFLVMIAAERTNLVVPTLHC